MGVKIIILLIRLGVPVEVVIPLFALLIKTMKVSLRFAIVWLGL